MKSLKDDLDQLVLIMTEEGFDDLTETLKDQLYGPFANEGKKEGEEKASGSLLRV